jgi:uncharacterized protein YndB with AHSA1/START domain
VNRVVKASRERVYSALVDADEVARWRFPTGMSIVVDQFEPREGGQVRVSLTYASSGVGKTKDGTDTYRGRFVELVPNERVVEIDEFETDDPSLSRRDANDDLSRGRCGRNRGGRFARRDPDWCCAR